MQIYFILEEAGLSESGDQKRKSSGARRQMHRVPLILQGGLIIKPDFRGCAGKNILIITGKCSIIAVGGDNMVYSTAMLLQQYSSYANPAAKIGRLVKDGDLIPIIKGLYETDRSVPGYCLAGILYGPSYLSFEFALAWHDLIPEAVYAFTSATCGKKKKKQYETPFGMFTFRDVPVAAFPYGTELHEENGYGFVIASAEKAVCDKLYTCSPCSNRTELKALLFDDLRIDETAFRKADLNEMAELAGLYHTTNHRLLISMIREMKRHGSHR